MVFRDYLKDFTHFKSTGAIDPQDVAQLDARGLIGGINVGNHYL